METPRSKPCTKKTKPTLNAASTTMAAKGKRAKVTSTKSSSDQSSGDPREVITRLESELEVERRSNTQLRREKAREVQQAREAEQNRSASSQKDLAARLHLEKQRDLEALRETLRSRHETEMVKAIRQKEAEIKRLQRDLLRCQDELKEEIAKRGLSTSARSAFELERAKMLQEIKELTNAKKQLEDALRSAAEAEKLRNLEVRQTKENCKLEVAKVEKEAAMEVRKLLEELKSKDHLLAQLDRNQYPDRSNCLRQHLANQSVEELLKISSEIEAVEAKVTGPKQEAVTTTTPSPTPAVTGLQNISWQKKVYELEKQIRLASGLNHAFIEKNKEVTTINNSLENKIKNLADENKELNSELSTAKVEMRKMNELFSGTSLEVLTNQLERVRKQIKEQEQVIAQLRYDCQDKDRRLKRIGKPKKAVRFLLPGETVPQAPGFDIDDVIADGRNGDDRYMDDNVDSMSLDSDATCQSSQVSDANLTDDDRELMEPGVLLESVEKDYELLMKEHLALEQSYASLIHSYSIRNDGEPPPEEWKIERESLNLAIWALEQKVRRCEENEEILRIKLEQVIEEKEELEFKVLEQEQCLDKQDMEPAEVEMLESELVMLRNKLDRYERGARASERDVGLQCDVFSEAEPEHSGEEIKVIEPRPSCMELSVENLSRLRLTSKEEEMETDSGSEMVLSFSTTASSGFDEMASEAEESIVADAPPTLKPVAEDGGKAGVDEGEKKKTIIIQSQPPENTNVPSTVDLLPVEAKEESGSGTDRMLEMEATIKSFQAMESSWKTTVEKLERQLQQSLLRERIIRDQVALVEEEKNRRICALQGQIDNLEDNETRLADTIQALEDMALGVDALQNMAESHMEQVPADELEREKEKLEGSRKQLKEQVEELVEAGRMLGQVKVKYADDVTVDEATRRFRAGTEGEVAGLVEAVEAALRNSIRHLESVNDQMEEEAKKERELGQRIQHLEASQMDEKAVERRKECPPSASAEVRKAVMECAQIMSSFAVEELQSDLKELRTLLIKLKAVIDSEEVDGKVKIDERPRSSGNKELRERLRLDVQPMEEWLTITPPGVKVFGEFCDRDQDTTDYELRQKVDEMEKECERLQNLVHEEDQVIRDLHFQNLELQESEKNFHQLVERLESAEEQMHGKMEEMAEEMERLQGLVKVLEVKERTTKSQLLKHQENELELEEQLEQTVEEMQNGKRKADRRIAELENEKKTLIRRTEDQIDRIGDLEGLTGSLKLRIRNFEASDSGLRSEIRKLESELSSAGSAVAELEQHREMLAQQVQDLEREKSKLLFEIADLTIDANKQGQKISLLNQEIGKLRGSIVNKDEVISCLQAKLDVAETVLEALRVKVADYESSSLVEEERMEASVRERDQRIRELEEELKQGREVNSCHQSTQTEVVPIRARIVIEKATSAFRDSFLSLGDRHPLILREFLSASLRPLLTSYEASSPVAAASVSKETMKRFIASLQVDFTSNSHVQVALESEKGDGEKRRSGVEAEEERQWSKVEDPRIIHEVRTAERSAHWKNIESRMGLDTDDLALTIEFKDTVETCEIEKTLSNANQSLMHDRDQAPPPLPTSSPPRLSPEPFAIKDDAEESADEASEINDEDDGAVAQACSNSIGPNWSAPHISQQNYPLSPRQQWPKLVPQASLDSQLENRKLRSRSVDRDCSPLSRNTFQGTELSRIAAGSEESITDSGMDSMQQGSSTFPRDMAKFQKVTGNSAEQKMQLRDQGTQAECDGEDDEPESSSVIVLKTQLEQREKELSAKSNQMDRLTVELRRWQREAVAAGEEKARLSALLGCALKDIKVMRENSITSPTSSTTPVSTPTPTRVPKSPFGFIGWGTSAGVSDRPPKATLLPSQIPVSTRHSSSTSEKDVAPTTKGHSFPTPNRRPASLHCSSELSQSSSSSLTDVAASSNSSSCHDSPSQDRRPITTSHLPRPIKEIGSNCLTSPPSSRKEANRLFRQSFEFSRPSSSRHSESSPCASGSESVVGDSTGPLATAAEQTTSTVIQGATVF